MPNKVALLIGVDQYGEGLPSLSAASNDVAAVQRVLQDKNLGDFDRVVSLVNPNPETMHQAIQEVFADCEANDLILLFFSGHAIFDETEQLYLTTNATREDSIKTTAIPASFVRQKLNNSPAKRQVVILDCCYYNFSAENNLISDVGTAIKKELSDEGRVILTSSTAVQATFEHKSADLSVYTQYLVEGLETGSADRDGAGLIYIRELHNYAKDNLHTSLPQIEPDIFLDKKELDILLTILLNLDPNSNPDDEYSKIEAKYRKIVEKYESQGEIPEIAQYTLNKKQQTFGITVNTEQTDELVSERGIDYTRLRDLLQAGNWKEADQETWALMLKVVNREADLSLNVAAVKTFPCGDLHTIDQLWLKYSDGQFGFSLQKEIWLSIGGQLSDENSSENLVEELEFNASLYALSSTYASEGMSSKISLPSLLHYQTQLYDQFGLRVGWRERKGLHFRRRWKDYGDLTFSLTWAPVGHLPTLVSREDVSLGALNIWQIRVNLFSRIEACWL